MSLDRFARIVRKHPQWERPLRAILRVVESYPPNWAVDPLVVAHDTGLPLSDVIGLMNVLVESELGRLMVRVVDANGLEVARFASVAQIPAIVENEFGDEIRVAPENVELIFVANETAPAA
jgi:hypothetical protein